MRWMFWFDQSRAFANRYAPSNQGEPTMKMHHQLAAYARVQWLQGNHERAEAIWLEAKIALQEWLSANRR